MKGEKELSVVCRKVMVRAMGRDESSERGSVHDKKHET